MTPTMEIACATLGNRGAGMDRLMHSLVAGGYPYQTRVVYEDAPRSIAAWGNDLFRGCETDICVWAHDDLEFMPGALAAIADAFLKRGDTDLMVGLNLTNQPAIRNVTDSAFFALGRDFMNRFPTREVFCPDYWHFSIDTELGEYAKAVDRFHWAASACVVHHHPGFSQDKADATYHTCRQHKARDAAIRRLRRERGLVWGLSWERVANADA